MKTISELQLADIISPHLVCVLPETTVESATRLMGEKHISCLIVMEENEPIGILTERDLVRLMHERTDPSAAVRVVMSSPVLTAPETLDFRAAFALLRRHDFRHLLAIAADGTVSGVASETDFRSHLGFNIFRRVSSLQAVIDPAVCILPPDASLSDAVARMLNERRDYVLVGSLDRAVGILTERDIPRLSAIHTALEQIKLVDVMTSPVHAVAMSANVSEVAQQMAENHLRHLVVLNPQGQVSGAISQHRLMMHLGGEIMDQAYRDAERWRSEIERIEDQLEVVLEAAGYGVWEYDHIAQQNIWSPALGELLQIPPENMTRFENWYDRIHPDDQLVVKAQVHKAIEGHNSLY